MYKLNLGSGPQKREGFLSVDRDSKVNPDILCDLEHEPIPLPDNSCSGVYAGYLLEHIEHPLRLMEEIWRVCVNGATVQIIVPYAGSNSGVKDPTHKSFFVEESWEYWDSRNKNVPHYGIKCKYDLVSLKHTYYEDATEEQLKNPSKYRNVIYNLDFVLKVVKP